MRIILLGLALACAGLAVEPLTTPELSLAKVRRIYVDQLGGGASADQMRDMLIAAIQNSRLFVLTEDPERADATLRGSSDDKIYTDQHTTSDSIGIHASAGGSSSSRASLGAGSSSSSHLGAGISDSEHQDTRERRHESSASVRLVSADGDVLWSTTQESNGAKFRGAMADVADKIARHLADDTKKARTAVSHPPESKQ